MLQTINGLQNDSIEDTAENLIDSSHLVEPKEQMADDLAVLKIYAGRVLGDGESLQPWEEIDKAVRIIEFFAVGMSFECSHRDLVRVLLRDLYQTVSG